MMNILNGGAHADNSVDIQEFMIAPVGAATFGEARALGRGDLPRAEVRDQAARAVHRGRGRGRLRPDLAQQPGRARPHRRGDRQGRVHPGRDIALAIDAAATEFYADGSYTFEGQARTADEMTEHLRGMAGRLPDRLAGGPAGRGGLGRLAGADRGARRPGPDRRRRHLRHQPRAAAPRHRRGRGQRAAGQAEPDRHDHRDAGRGHAGAAQPVMPA